MPPRWAPTKTPDLLILEAGGLAFWRDSCSMKRFFMKKSLPPLGLFFGLLASPLHAAVVWEIGAPGIDTVNFAKLPFTDPTLPENQDSISPSVTLTRLGDNNAAWLYNILEEDAPALGTPSGTRWAFGGLNGNPSNFSAGDFGSLIFADFRTAHGGTNAPIVVGRDGVLHLVAEDIYLDISFTFWGRGNQDEGGSFAYARASGPIPEPSLAVLLAVGGLGFLRRKR